MTASLTLLGPRNVSGSIHLPGSKSISNRALLLAALAKGTTRIENLLVSDDTKWMLAALQTLGCSVELNVETKQAQVVGQGGLFHAPQQLQTELFLGNAGTAMRPLTAVLAASQGQFLLTGEPRMFERPIGDLVRALEQLGADIRYAGNDDYPPLVIQGRVLKGGAVSIHGGLSSQYISAVLMLLPLLQENSELEITGPLVSLPYIELTLGMMAQFGVEVERLTERNYRVRGQQQYQAPASYSVEGDASSASYFLAAAAIAGEITVSGVGRKSLQGDRLFAEVLEKMGAQVEYADTSIHVRKGDLVGGDFDLNAIPDAAMTIATTALFAKGSTTIRNIGNWRIKETDRLAAMATELRKVGATVEEGEDFIVIEPPEQIQHAKIATYNDHRMAMCFSLLALAPAGVTILDPRCCEKTYPSFFQDFASICTQ